MMKDIKVDTNNVSQNDYPELEGKIIKIKGCDLTDVGAVIGVNRHVGITIVDANDKNTFLVCWAGPIMPGYMKGEFKDDNHFVDAVVAQIKSGTVDVDILHEHEANRVYGTCSGTNCAYSR